MNHQKKQAAVTRLLPLIGGKSEQEVKELLAADDKAYTTGEVEEIYQALLSLPDASAQSKYKVNFGVHIPDLGRSYTKEEIEADQVVIDYLVDIKSGAVSIIKEGKV